MLLMERAVSGKVINTGKLTLLKMSGETKLAYLELELKKCVVTGFHVSASGNGQLPMESATLHFVKVKSTYIPQSNEGHAESGVEFSWNLQTNEHA